MMGMGSDKKKLGGLILALSSNKEEMEKPDPYKEMVVMCAQRVMQAIKENDVEMFISELPKLINNLPQPEVEFDD